MDHPTGGRVGVGWNLQPRHGAWPVDSPPQCQRGQICGKVLQAVHAGPRELSGDSASERIEAGVRTGPRLAGNGPDGHGRQPRSRSSTPGKGGEGARPRHRARVMRCSPVAGGNLRYTIIRKYGRRRELCRFLPFWITLTGGLSLPMFQRGYLWTRPQVKKLMQSLYGGYPVRGLRGSILLPLQDAYLRTPSVDSG